MSAGGKALAYEMKEAMARMPYKELFGFKPTGGAAPLLLILGMSPSSREIKKGVRVLMGKRRSEE